VVDFVHVHGDPPAVSFGTYTLTEPGPELGSADVVGTEENRHVEAG
jgi:hypothetical protein